jgi:hypothetical protein
VKKTEAMICGRVYVNPELGVGLTVGADCYRVDSLNPKRESNLLSPQADEIDAWVQSILQKRKETAQ